MKEFLSEINGWISEKKTFGNYNGLLNFKRMKALLLFKIELLSSFYPKFSSPVHLEIQNLVK